MTQPQEDSIPRYSETCPICGLSTPLLHITRKGGEYRRNCPAKDDERHQGVRRRWRQEAREIRRRRHDR